MQSELVFTQLQDFFSTPQALKTAASIKEGSQIAIQIKDLSTFCLKKTEDSLILIAEAPSHPDLTFFVGPHTSSRLLELKNEDIGTLGLSIFKLMMSNDTQEKITLKIHSDFLTLLRNGYFQVLAQGGPAVMQFLTQNGFDSFSKIKSVISQMRDK